MEINIKANKEEFIELQKKLRRIKGMKHLADADDVIWFYDLYPVIRENPEYLSEVSGSAGSSVDKLNQILERGNRTLQNNDREGKK